MNPVLLVIITIASISVGLIVFSLFYRELNPIKEEILQNQTSSSSISLVEESRSSTIEKEIEIVEVDNTEILEFIKNFSNKWMNYSDVYERNQSVREYLADECIKENTIDVDPHVEYESKGTIQSIAQDMENERKFVVSGVESAKGYANDFVFILRLAKNELKISEITVWYVRTGY